MSELAREFMRQDELENYDAYVAMGEVPDPGDLKTLPVFSKVVR